MSDALEGLGAALAEHYAIERQIGAGGMATVYLARDLKHDRAVALKVLRPELAAVLGIERFLGEIRVTAPLQHPHILPLFDSGQAGGLIYYVMPHVEGESLRHRLDREKQLPIEEAVRLASGIASALDYAHRHGVIHRDIKPENILFQDGQAVVADFGIALALSAAAGSRLTETGPSLGTPQYMSPEQATGDRLIDARSDIYSLASVLYELLAGEPPHTGPTVQSVIAKVLTDRPRPLRQLRESVPPHVEAAVLKALAKVPADRFQTAAQFIDALARPAGPCAPGRHAERPEPFLLPRRTVGGVLLGQQAVQAAAWWRSGGRGRRRAWRRVWSDVGDHRHHRVSAGEGADEGRRRGRKAAAAAPVRHQPRRIVHVPPLPAGRQGAAAANPNQGRRPAGGADPRDRQAHALRSTGLEPALRIRRLRGRGHAERNPAGGAVRPRPPRDHRGGGAPSPPGWGPNRGAGRIGYSRGQFGRGDLYWIPADGSGPAELLLVAPEDQWAGDVTPDGRTLLFRSGGGGPVRSIHTLSLQGPRTAQPFLANQFDNHSPSLSPDGHWVASVSNESGRLEVYVRPFPGSGGRWQVSLDGGSEPVWAANGHELFYRNGTKMMVAAIALHPTFTVGARRELFEANYVSDPVHRSYDVTRDGRGFVLVRSPKTSGEFIIVLNWFDQLREQTRRGTAAAR